MMCRGINTRQSSYSILSMKENERKAVHTVGQDKKSNHQKLEGQKWVYNIAVYSSYSHNTVLSTCPLHTNSGCGKEGRVLIGRWWPAKAALVRNYLEVYWPCAGGLSAVNAIGAQLRDPNDKLGTDPMVHGGFINGRRRGTREEYRNK